MADLGTVICPPSPDPLYFPWGLCLSLHPATLGHPNAKCQGSPDLRDRAGSGWKREGKGDGSREAHT